MSRRTQRQPGPISFDVLKARARRAFAAQLQSLADSPTDCAARFPGLPDFLRLLTSNHSKVATLVANIGQASAPAQPRQETRWLDAQEPVDREALWAQARAQGICSIEQWDVRCVVSLIRYFPQCVGRRRRPRHAVCWIVDDPEGHWVVSFAPHASGRLGAQDPDSQH